MELLRKPHNGTKRNRINNANMATNLARKHDTRIHIPRTIPNNNTSPSRLEHYGSDNTQYNILTSLQGLCAVAAQYGIYVDICPAGISSYGNGDWNSWTTSQWTSFWTTMANGLKSYPNAIFEAWNEPVNNGSWNDPITSSYLTYVSTMYNAIRGAGLTNLIFVQWHAGWAPNGAGYDLSWAAQVNSALGNPTNVVYTTHLYYYAPPDNSPYWDSNGVACWLRRNSDDYSADTIALQGLEQTMGVNAPLVINEFGDCLSSSPLRTKLRK